MDPTLAHLLEVVLLDAVKILGPATIAGVVAYRSASAQHASKLQELRQAHSFEAHRAIFDYTKERLAETDVRLEKINQDLLNVLGYITGLNGDDPKDSPNAILIFLGKAAMSIALPTRLEVRNTLADLERLEQDRSEVFIALSRYRDFDIPKQPQTLEAIQECLLTLRELHGVLALSLRAFLSAEIQAALVPFVKGVAAEK